MAWPAPLLCKPPTSAAGSLFCSRGGGMNKFRAGYITQSGNTPPAEAMGRWLQAASWGNGLTAAGKWLFLAVLFLPIGNAAGRVQSSIIGGKEAEPHSRPYMVSIQYGGRHACGGALIHKRWVLTAAHCYCLRKLPIQVVVGLHRQPGGNGPEHRFSVVKVVVHPSYNCVTMANDIMLLKLDRKVRLKQASRIQLATKAPAPGDRCSVAGWGISERKGEPSPVLQELDVQVMDVRMCNNSRFWRGEITETMVCIEGVKRGSAPCKGDSGGPVVCGKKAQVAAVLSFADQECINLFKPPVATAVFKYRKWIRKVLPWP